VPLLNLPSKGIGVPKRGRKKKTVVETLLEFE
jgi:hypothetical protein